MKHRTPWGISYWRWGLFLVFVLPLGLKAQPSATVTYLANEGFFIQSGETGILIDAFFKETFGQYQALPELDANGLRQALPPYDEVDLILITHAHADHFAPEWVNRFLSLNRHCQLIASPQAHQQMKEAGGYHAVWQDRILEVKPRMQREWVDLSAKGIDFRIAWLRHPGKKNHRVINLVYDFEVAGQRILHLGDTEVIPDNFHHLHFDQEAWDLALIPFWFMLDEEGQNLMEKYLRARRPVAMHVPTAFAELQEAIHAYDPDIEVMVKPGTRYELLKQ